MTAERFPVEAGHIQLFAQAIGDHNPAYVDDGSGDVVAPPTFPMAAALFDPDNPLRPKPGEKWFGSASGPGYARSGGGGGGLHAEQIFEYHRPLRTGDVLTGSRREGRSWEKESKRGGKLNFAEHIIDYHDQNGDPVVSVTMVSVVPEINPTKSSTEDS